MASKKKTARANTNAFSVDDIVAAVMVHEAPAISWRGEAKELNGAAKVNRLRAHAALMHRVAVVGLDNWHRGMSGTLKAALIAKGATKDVAKAISEVGQGVLAADDDILSAAVAGEAELLALFEERDIKTESALKAIWKPPVEEYVRLAAAVHKLDEHARAAFHAALKALEEKDALAAERGEDAAALAASDTIASE